ncbi:shikimate kinase [Chryseobacterium koreense]|uniref:Shikimate kinase n=1 Tax=Chryseobacterium koreense CCUG 49689 TaxID=1304281 RepID=A0A0J7J187_9FLAO|nr:shikimate kinase [Chryseobacterium koreense]KMQ71824.1 shikimate kinase [Chryseobacterium koreense CCUG 49689]MBB5333272.1 shikimate kinase [Chryseobacterium koreense]
MIISLIGYMGSGKSHISKLLSQEMDLKLIDLDKEISLQYKMPVSEIFEKKGELFFRRAEREKLEEILAKEKNCVLSVGGGTPAYYNNMEIINQNTESVFLRTSVGTLANRLARQKSRRPIIAKINDDDLPEFIAKHLFERNHFYSRAKFTVDTDHKNPDEISSEIRALFNPR